MDGERRVERVRRRGGAVEDRADGVRLALRDADVALGYEGRVHVERARPGDGEGVARGRHGRRALDGQLRLLARWRRVLRVVPVLKDLSVCEG